MKIENCPICKGTNIIKTPSNYGIVQVAPPANVYINNAIPLNVYICKDCGYTFLFHVDPSAIKIDSKD